MLFIEKKIVHTIFDVTQFYISANRKNIMELRVCITE